MRRFFLGLMAFAMLAFSPACSVAADSNSLRDQTSAAMVEMSIMLPDGSYRLTCTTQAIAPHVLLTAKHCFDNKPPDTAWFFGPKHTYDEKATVILAIQDTVFIRTSLRWKATTALSERAPRNYEKVYGFGYGLGLPKTYREGVYSGKGALEDSDPAWNGDPMWMFSIPITPGDSGMGIVGEHGKIFCVVSLAMSAEKGGHVTACVPISLTPAQRKLVYGP